MCTIQRGGGGASLHKSTTNNNAALDFVNTLLQIIFTTFDSCDRRIHLETVVTEFKAVELTPRIWAYKRASSGSIFGLHEQSESMEFFSRQWDWPHPVLQFKINRHLINIKASTSIY